MEMEVQAKDRWRMLTRAGAAQDKTVMERIMLGFRPIAPKPVAGGAASGNLQAVNKNLMVSNGRSKRKYVRVRKNRDYRRKNNNKTSTDHHGSCNKDGLDDKIVTLQLLPESGDLEYSKRREPWCNIDVDGTGIEIEKEKEKVVIENKINQGFQEVGGLGLADQRVEMGGRRVVETWVTVERVMSSDGNTCMDGRGGLGSEDFEIMKNLENDTCPGFISDGLNKVKWVNGAYRRMVRVREEGEGEGEDSEERTTIVVLLVMKEKLPWVFSSLTCKVRVEYTWKKEKYWKKMVMPCDVWRMECGGFAWRLDVEAALSLGR
ncbi:hypothetical protein Patl1_02960 [Pistacia atlantica]|uniref:Uncharacterized protein n=1 Tax=Pistacia atlantica TaxID=434234 RepID=A0ACC1C8G5_9ROSI|nr:hypothetical protein Patl1_02960 [Pistacia atlantica]